MRVLDVNPSPISFLDDTLLFVCLPAHFVFAFVKKDRGEDVEVEGVAIVEGRGSQSGCA